MRRRSSTARLSIRLSENIQAVRADRPVRVPTVLTPEEVKGVIGDVEYAAVGGEAVVWQRVAFDRGLRLRVQDLDFEMKQLTVRDGKGAKDRYTRKG